MSNGFPLVLRAAAFAAEKHRHQRRKDADASPYINHPLAVATVLSHEGAVQDAIVLAVALLHDTLEDTDATADELAAHFGPQVAAIVAELSDDKSLPKTERKRLQIEHAANLSTPARLVKLADKICNLRDIATAPPAGWTVERKREYFDWARIVVDRMRGTHEGLEAAFDAAYGERP